MGDLLHSLRKLSFPQCAKEALRVINQITRVHDSSNITTKSMEMISAITEEFIFCENVQGNKEINGLNSFQELQLLDILCSCLSQESQAERNAIFFCLFPTNDDRRTGLLVKLVSMAVATKTTQVLSAAGTWLQQYGCHNSFGVSLAKSIVNDYLVLVPEGFQQLYDLPHLAPEFAANLLAAMTEYYKFTDTELIPPPALLKVIALWASESPGLCTTPLTTSHPPNMPFMGLVRWCVMAPLLGCEDPEPYSQLHLALIESIVFSTSRSLVTAGNLACLVALIHKLVPTAQLKDAHLSIDRFTQIVIVLLRTGKVPGNYGELFLQMETLPQNELLGCFTACRNLIISP